MTNIRSEGMGKDKNSSNEEYDISEELLLLGQQVSELMEESKKIVNTEQSESASISEEVIDDRLKDKEDTIDFLAQEVAAVKEVEPEDEIHKNTGDTFLSEEPELEEINDSLAEQISSAIVEEAAFQEHQLMKKKKKKKIIIGSSIVVALLVAICVLLFTKAGQKAVIETVVAPNLYNQMFDYDVNPTTIPLEEDTLLNGENHSTVGVTEGDHVVNVLLIGVEEIEYAQNTDVMIIASMNRDTNELSIISLMRDLYVQIPGHSNNKLNAAYSLGGIDLLYQTIELNFGVHMDGYILVNFDTFETVVDLLGGISVTLTQDEASYLNRTNYISNPYNRTVVAGTQTMNGNQALGYCRIRYVSTGKEINDFGRTARHRAVLNSMFDKLTSKNLFQLVSFMNQVFSNVQLTTDISKNRFSEYLTEVVDLNISELEQHRVPADDGYYDDKIYIGEHKQWVLIPNDWQETKTLLHEYIYGEESTTETTAQNIN